MLGLVTLPALVSCQPSTPAPGAECHTERPDEGQVLVEPLLCSDPVPPGGEGRADADVYLATHDWRAILRHPQDALTVAGWGGGTLVDAAAWEGPDAVHEVIPLVGGGWLTEIEATLLADAVRLEGTDLAGERRTVTWRPDPDGPWLVAEGADALRIDPAGDAEVLGGLVLAPPTVIGEIGRAHV